MWRGGKDEMGNLEAVRLLTLRDCFRKAIPGIVETLGDLLNSQRHLQSLEITACFDLQAVSNMLQGKVQVLVYSGIPEESAV